MSARQSRTQPGGERLMMASAAARLPSPTARSRCSRFKTRRPISRSSLIAYRQRRTLATVASSNNGETRESVVRTDTTIPSRPVEVGLGKLAAAPTLYLVGRGSLGPEASDYRPAGITKAIDGTAAVGRETADTNRRRVEYDVKLGDASLDPLAFLLLHGGLLL